MTASETVWVNDVYEHERTRVEFEHGRVRAIERLRQREDRHLEESPSDPSGTERPPDGEPRHGAAASGDTLAGGGVKKP